MGGLISNLKYMGKIMSILLAILALCGIVLSVKGYLEEPSADAYEDMGIETFYPTRVLPHQESYSQKSGHRRTSGTRTVYEIVYQSASRHKWTPEVGSKESAQKIVTEGEPVDRRILHYKGETSYITIPAEDTVDSYVQKNRRSYLRGLALSGLYLAIGGGIILWKRKNT